MSGSNSVECLAASDSKKSGEKRAGNLCENARGYYRERMDMLSLIPFYLRKCFIFNHLDTMVVEPLFPACYASNVQQCFTRAISEANTF
jgi:hypothetical protein